MKTSISVATVAIVLAMSSQAAAQDNLSAAFGARESVDQVSISPDGTHVALLVNTGDRGNSLQVVDLATGQSSAIIGASGRPERIADCHWSTDIRIVCRVATLDRGPLGILRFSRAVAIDRDGKQMKLLSARTNDRSLGIMQNGGDIIDWTGDGKPGSVLTTRTFVPEGSTGTHIASTAQGLGVERLDTTTLARRVVESPRIAAVDYISDGLGSVRIMGLQSRTSGGYDKDHIDYLYRTATSRDWKPLGTLRFTPQGYQGFNPIAVDRGTNVAFGFDDKDGRRALYSIALDGSLKHELVLARPDVDVDQLISIGRQDRVVGASYATDKRAVEFFDPDLKTLAASMRKSLPKESLVSFIDASADESKLVVFVGNDTDAGRYYVLDRKTRHMDELVPSRPPLEKIALAPVKAITYRAQDGTTIPAYLTVPVGSTGRNLPAIVMPHGGPSARDEWGFDWLAQFYAARGFVVLQPNFRGSAGYGAQWFQKNGFQSWRTAIGDVDDAGRWLVAQGIADPAKLGIVGWSYGGYAALQSAVVDPDLFKAVVAIAPVTDLETLRSESADFTNHALVDAFIGHGPHIKDGSPARNAERIKAPVLLFHGDLDTNVGIGESRLMASKLRSAGKKVELVEFAGLDHQLPDDKARASMLAKSDAFLRNAMGIK